MDTENNQLNMIRFINSDYLELFQIPDGGSIIINKNTSREKVYKCQYVDEMHTCIGTHIYHNCQFAEIMERNGNRYEPECQLENLTILAPPPETVGKPFDYESIKNRCVGMFRGEFRYSDGRYFCRRAGFENVKTNQAQRETAEIVYFLRKYFFQSKENMQDYCNHYLGAKDADIKSDKLSVYLFKVDAKKYDYYIKCVNEKDYDSRFYVYCCKKERQRTNTEKPKKQESER